MKTPITYYGGKQNLVKEILPLIPEHKQYVEPFFGGGAVFWAKGQSPHEVINDVDNRVINFWECCNNGNFTKLQKKIKNTLHSEYYYKQAKKILSKPCKNKIDYGWAFWTGCMLNHISSMGTGFCQAKIDKSVRRVERYQQRFTTAIHERLKLVEIFCRDAINLIKLKDGKDTFFYFDPPYVGADAGHYQDKVEVFGRLIEILPGLKAKWMLSTYDVPEIQHLLKIYNHKKIKQIKSADKQKGKDTRSYKIEVLIYNYEVNPKLNFAN